MQTDRPVVPPAPPTTLEELLRQHWRAIGDTKVLEHLADLRRRGESERLQRAVAAWVAGLLPGWTLKRPKRRPGRRPTGDEGDPYGYYATLDDYFDVLKAIQPVVEAMRGRGAVDALPRKGAPGGERLRYITRSIETAHGQTIRGYLREALPPEAAQRVARYALRRRDTSAEALAYHLLAHYWRCRPKSAREAVRRARAALPEYCAFLRSLT